MAGSAVGRSSSALGRFLVLCCHSEEFIDTITGILETNAL
jgi:hypothetical protein